MSRTLTPVRPRARAVAAGAAALLVASGLSVIAAAPASAATFTVNSGADAVDADLADGLCETATAGQCTLRAAVQQANAAAGADTVEIDVDEVTLTIAPDGEAADASDAAATGDLDVTGPLVLDGGGARIVQDAADRVLHVVADASLTLRATEVTSGTAPGAPSATGGGSGGGALNAGTLVVEGSTFADNTALRAGGGVEAVGGSTTTISRSGFLGNSTGASPGNGGGLHLTGAGRVDVRASRFAENTAANEGGGAWNSAAGTMTVDDTEVVDNVADGDPAESGGGGLFNDGGTLAVSGGRVEGNSATGTAGSGGGILNQGTLRVTGTEIAGNDAVRAGGGVESAPGGSGATPTTSTTTELTRVVLTGNTTGAAPGNGGGFHQTGGGTVSVVGATVTGNTAANEGGGLWNSAAASMTVRDTAVRDNTANGTDATSGGGGVYTDGGRVDVVGGTIAGNDAAAGSGSGGGVLNVGGTVSLTGTTVQGNTARRAGGGVEAANVPAAEGTAARSSTTTLAGVQLVGNSTGPVPGNGGGLHLTGPGDVDVSTSTVSGNTAANEGGGLWNSAVGTMTVTATTLDGNTASGSAADSGGGALYNDGGTLSTLNSTLSGNTASSAGGGLLTVGGPVSLRQTTVTDGSSGVHGAVALRTSIVAGNRGADCTGPVTSSGGNVVGSTCPSSGAGDRGAVSDPRLAGLANNGGPTRTRAPQPGSPAIDVVAQSACTGTDQRGAPRPVDGDGDGSALCDAGAVEAGSAAPRGSLGRAPAPRSVTAQPTFTG